MIAVIINPSSPLKTQDEYYYVWYTCLRSRSPPVWRKVLQRFGVWARAGACVANILNTYRRRQSCTWPAALGASTSLPSITPAPEDPHAGCEGSLTCPWHSPCGHCSYAHGPASSDMGGLFHTALHAAIPGLPHARRIAKSAELMWHLGLLGTCMRMSQEHEDWTCNEC